ncbi:MAG: ATPase, T2SS/T4P/T4SS family [Geobacteraceae bacterium]
MYEKKMGEILLENKLVNKEQLDEALSMQKVFPDQTIGQLLCKLGFLQDSDLAAILQNSGKRQRLTDLLVKDKLIDSAQLSAAITFSVSNKISIANALLRLNYLDESALARVIAIQYDLSLVNISAFELEQDISGFISPSYAQKQEIVPISRIGNSLTVAMTYPLKQEELSELENSIRLKIIPVIAPKGEIIAAQQRLYKTLPQTHHEEMNLEIAPDTIGELLDKGDSLDEPEINDEVRKVTEKDSIIVKLVNKIIFDAYMLNASDIHIEPYPGKNDLLVRLRIDGRCIVYQKIPYRYKFAIPSRVKIMAVLDIAERRRPQDGKINFKKFGPADVELRVATMPTSGNLEDVVIRLLRTGNLVLFDQLGLTERNMQVFEKAITKPYGLILVVGPTGSGKTTTLHSAVAKINTPDIKIWTAEDPVEIVQTGLRQVQVNPRIGFTFASALRSFMRLDPDVIMVGEMRDIETASTAVEASLTGHMVLSTLHTNSASETITRLLEMGLDPYSFSDSLLCILSQRLARTLCPDCKATYVPDQTELTGLIEEYGAEQFAQLGLSESGIVPARPVGCTKCAGTGYRGRVGLHELLECNDALKILVKNRADNDIIRNQAILDGMTTLKQDGIIKVFKGITDIHEVRRVCIR